MMDKDVALAFIALQMEFLTKFDKVEQDVEVLEKAQALRETYDSLLDIAPVTEVKTIEELVKDAIETAESLDEPIVVYVPDLNKTEETDTDEEISIEETPGLFKQAFNLLSPTTEEIIAELQGKMAILFQEKRKCMLGIASEQTIVGIASSPSWSVPGEVEAALKKGAYVTAIVHTVGDISKQNRTRTVNLDLGDFAITTLDELTNSLKEELVLIGTEDPSILPEEIEEEVVETASIQEINVIDTGDGVEVELVEDQIVFDEDETDQAEAELAAADVKDEEFESLVGVDDYEAQKELFEDTPTFSEPYEHLELGITFIDYPVSTGDLQINLEPAFVRFMEARGKINEIQQAEYLSFIRRDNRYILVAGKYAIGHIMNPPVIPALEGYEHLYIKPHVTTEIVKYKFIVITSTFHFALGFSPNDQWLKPNLNNAFVHFDDAECDSLLARMQPSQVAPPVEKIEAIEPAKEEAKIPVSVIASEPEINIGELMSSSFDTSGVKMVTSGDLSSLREGSGDYVQKEVEVKFLTQFPAGPADVAEATKMWQMYVNRRATFESSILKGNGGPSSHKLLNLLNNKGDVIAKGKVELTSAPFMDGKTHTALIQKLVNVQAHEQGYILTMVLSEIVRA